jgi:short-subunit dehydrogenase
MEMNLLGISVSVIRPGATKTPLLGDSTSALDKFIESTKIYKTNSKRFKAIVDSVEAKNVSPEKIGELAYRIISSKMPRYVYNINRNPLLLILNALPQRLQNFIIKLILTR